MDKNIPVEVSARHCHLAKEELEILFGEGYQLTNLKQLSQPSDFACQETITLQSENGKQLENVRIVGPLREQTQIEISKTDALILGVNPPIKLSGDLDDSIGIKLIGPNGEVTLEKGLIIALRHIHCNEQEAKELGLKNNDAVAVKIDSERPVTFYDVLIRIGENYKLCMHIDTDEGNASGLNKTGQGLIL